MKSPKGARSPKARRGDGGDGTSSPQGTVVHEVSQYMLAGTYQLARHVSFKYRQDGGEAVLLVKLEVGVPACCL